MSRRSGLGRGLGALIPTEAVRTSGSVLQELPLSQINPNQFQPRKNFDEESLSSLVDSIRAVGVLQPVLVRQIDGAEYELIAG
ncbi:MAG: ParB N-terminal domain-containing protein, partial [Thermoplasmata archaeon]|nr:ParB N-terminal domain-containing protein [Thermoplasmata archaeon]